MKARGVADFYSVADNLVRIALLESSVTKFQKFIPVNQQKRLRFVIGDYSTLLIETYGLGVHAKEMTRFLIAGCCAGRSEGPSYPRRY